MAEESALPRDNGILCLNCGEPRTGRFCSRCGEKEIEPEDYAFIRFLAEAFQVITSVEGTTFRSFAALITHPGLLTADYLRGRRVRYLKPLQVFLFCNVVFFLTQLYVPINTLTTPLFIHLYRLPYSPLVRPLVTATLLHRHLTYPAYQKLFDAAIKNHAQEFVIAMVPLLALFVQALYPRARRYYTEHVIFAAHFLSFFLLLLPAVSLLLSVPQRLSHPVAGQASFLDSEPMMDATLLGISAAYLYRATRRVYPQSTRSALLRSLLLIASLLLTLQAYRFLLFWITYFTV